MMNHTSNHTIIDKNDVNVLFLAIINKCNEANYSYIRVPQEIITIVLCLPSNLALLWLLLKGNKTLSSSHVLGLNLSVLNIICCLLLPLDVYISLTYRKGVLLSVTEALSVLNIIGCPLLLTGMCLERYIATVHPVLYIKVVNKWKYRIYCATLIWIITSSISLIVYKERLPKLVMYLSITLDLCLMLMLACLIGIICVLCKKGPGEGPRREGSVKKRALKNTLLILIPTAIIYGPLLGLLPFVLTLQSEDAEVTYTSCLILNLVHTFTSFGAIIGPVFYYSRMKQLACWLKRAGKEEMNQEQQHHK